MKIENICLKYQPVHPDVEDFGVIVLWSPAQQYWIPFDWNSYYQYNSTIGIYIMPQTILLFGRLDAVKYLGKTLNTNEYYFLDYQNPHFQIISQSEAEDSARYSDIQVGYAISSTELLVNFKKVRRENNCFYTYEQIQTNTTSLQLFHYQKYENIFMDMDLNVWTGALLNAWIANTLYSQNFNALYYSSDENRLLFRGVLLIGKGKLYNGFGPNTQRNITLYAHTNSKLSYGQIIYDKNNSSYNYFALLPKFPILGWTIKENDYFAWIYFNPHYIPIQKIYLLTAFRVFGRRNTESYFDSNARFIVQYRIQTNNWKILFGYPVDVPEVRYMMNCNILGLNYIYHGPGETTYPDEFEHLDEYFETRGNTQIFNLTTNTYIRTISGPNRGKLINGTLGLDYLFISGGDRYFIYIREGNVEDHFYMPMQTSTHTLNHFVQSWVQQTDMPNAIGVGKGINLGSLFYIYTLGGNQSEYWPPLDDVYLPIYVSYVQRYNFNDNTWILSTLSLIDGIGEFANFSLNLDYSYIAYGWAYDGDTWYGLEEFQYSTQIFRSAICSLPYRNGCTVLPHACVLDFDNALIFGGLHGKYTARNQNAYPPYPKAITDEAINVNRPTLTTITKTPDIEPAYGGGYTQC